MPKYVLSKKKGKNVSTGHMDAPSYGKKKKKTRSKMTFWLPFIVPDIVYKFLMICLWGT